MGWGKLRFVLAACLAFQAPTAPRAQDTTVDALTVTGGEAPLPIVGTGSPNYSPEQTASAICFGLERGYAVATMRRLSEAHEATMDARMARRAFTLGRVGEARVKAMELARQAALPPKGPMVHVTAATLPKAEQAGLAIQNLTYERANERGKGVLLDKGQVRNISGGRLYLPPISLFAIDARDFVLAGQTNVIDPEVLEAGQSQAFAVRFRNPPAYTVRMQAAFAPPFQTRNFRGCEFLDPKVFDIGAIDVTRLAAAMKNPSRPVVNEETTYTASQLAVLARIAFDDATEAYLATQATRSGVRPATGCAAVQPWRKLMALSEKLDEAWVAANAAEEIRRDAKEGIFLPEEIREADRVRDAAFDAFRAARPVSRALLPAPAGLSIETTEMRPRDHAGAEVVVAATLRNDSGATVDQAPLLMTIKDRFGYVVSERIVNAAGPVRHNTSRTFSFTIQAPAALSKDVTLRLAC